MRALQQRADVAAIHAQPGFSADLFALIRHIEQYIAHWNDHPTPFVWTKAPPDIIAKAIRRGR